MKIESIDELMGRLPVGSSIVRVSDHWQYHENGKLVSGAFSLSVLLGMEVGQANIEDEDSESHPYFCAVCKAPVKKALGVWGHLDRAHKHTAVPILNVSHA